MTTPYFDPMALLLAQQRAEQGNGPSIGSRQFHVPAAPADVTRVGPGPLAKYSLPMFDLAGRDVQPARPQPLASNLPPTPLVNRAQDVMRGVAGFAAAPVSSAVHPLQEMFDAMSRGEGREAAGKLGEAGLATALLALPGGAEGREVGQLENILSRGLREGEELPHFAIISGENPQYQRLTQAENDLRHAALGSHLRDLGYNPVEIQSHFGAPERAWFIPGADERQVGYLADLYDQQSFITHKGLHNLSGESAGKTFPVTGIERRPVDAADEWSQLQHSRDSPRFKLNFDFDNPVPNVKGRRPVPTPSTTVPEPGTAPDGRILTETPDEHLRNAQQFESWGLHEDAARRRQWAAQAAAEQGFADEPKLLGTQPSDIMNKEEEIPVVWSLAHHTLNANSKDEWLQSVGTQFPGLAAQLRENPVLADRLYKRANVYQDFVRSLPSSEQTLLDFHDPKSQALMNWYQTGGTYRGLQNVGVPEPVADKFDQFRAILSPETPPENEVYGALQALQAHENGVPLDSQSFQNDIRWVTGKSHTDKVLKLTNAQAGGRPWATEPGGAIKTSPYYLTGRGQNSLPVVDVHMARYYTGRPLAGKGRLTTPQRHVLSARLLHDAQLAGVSPDQFQAGLWAKQTGYDFGFGQEGASPLDWARFHLASGEFDDLIQRYPGLQRLANEGHAGIAGLAPDKLKQLQKRWPNHQGLTLPELPF